jgi:hypothetical protein
MPRLSLLLTAWLLLAGWSEAAAPTRTAPPTVAALTSIIDSRLAASFRETRVLPGPRADDPEFLRRIYLDLVGRIPTVYEARRFLDDERTDKRLRLVESLLASTGHTVHTAQVWRGFLVPQATTNLPTQHLAVSLEVWLREQLRAGHRDDRIVRDLLTTRLDYLDWTADKRPRPAGGLSAVAFYQANDLKPETVAAAVGRTFLGLRLECAQCHDHPFDKWTREQAWETAAFFAGVAPLEPRVEPAADLANRRELLLPGSSRKIVARFLDGSSPDWSANPDPRQAFADWLTRPGNPWFARVMANRIWANLFGVGLVDPVDDWGPHNPPSHPELLDELSSAYVASGFDAKFLIRAITASAAYQRSSRMTHPSQSAPRSYARMNVKGLSAEQLFDSLATATGYRDPVPLASRSVEGWPARSPRGQFLARFGGGSARTDMQVSILQALSLMNGDWLARQTDPDQGETLRAVLAAPFLSDERRVETLFLAALSRRPTPAERDRYLAHLASTADANRALSDLLWTLLNSHEFLVNR